MGRSLTTSVKGLEIAKPAFRRKYTSQQICADIVGCSRQVVGQFLRREPVEAGFFQSICAELGLAWEKIADLAADTPEPIQGVDLDRLVQEVRNKVSANIQKRCGTMRVLDMSQPITIDSIYTSVNILEKISRNQRRSIEELQEECEVEDFDRFILGMVKQKRILALEAVERHDKLMILGKPGAGKTTFLKWLALQCNGGRVLVDRVPFFITLKEFAEMDGQPDLQGFIAKQLIEYGVENGEDVGERILQAGRSIVLLDGLDEVKAQDHDRVLKNIRQSEEKFYTSQFVITCRIAAKEYIFDQFTEVEVADFNDDQIADFAHKWFQQKDPIKAKEFPKELEAFPGLQELATNPLLLTLLCLVFEERAGFPASRSELYKEGLDVLLKKWDATRNIKREEVYKQLSLQRKEDLLSQVAYRAFEHNDFFFKQKFVEEQIREYIRNLPNARTGVEALQLDSEAVLNSIASQHGLLVERARGIYSFSHLTFQEYFTASWFKEKADGDFGDLISHITDKQWREVFFLTVGMLKNADKLLKGMKWEIDSLLAQDEDLQRFLDWVEKKSASIKNHYKPAAVRAYYFFLGIGIALDFYLDRSRYQSLSQSHNLYHSRYQSLALDIDIDCSHARSLGFDLYLDRSLGLDQDLEVDSVVTLVLDSALDFDVARTLIFALKRASDCVPKDLKKPLKQLLRQLSGNRDFNNWWQANGQNWIEQLRDIMIHHRNIGHDWQFSDNQKKLLQQYYEANKLLVECINSDCYISREVRVEIESTLLLSSKEL
jgi:predicted NACHT family NTPase